MTESVTPRINISVTFRHTESTDALKSYAIEKLLHVLQKFVSHDADARVILSVEKRDHMAEVVLLSKGFDITLKSTTEDLYSAIDKLADTLSRQLKKQKEKVSSHKHQQVSL